MIPTRRALASGAAALALAPSSRAQTMPQTSKARTRLILLGTKGGPRVGGDRSNPANAIIVGDTPFIIDCGYGVTRQMIRAGIPPVGLRYIFVSHHHSDHNLEYGNLYYNAWVAGSVAKVEAYGAPGLEALTRDYFRLNHIDIQTRMEDEGRKDPRELLVAHDIKEDGLVLKTDEVTVTAFQTPHPPMTDLAFRFDTPDGSIVLTGDTAYNPKLADFARGADILVHEVIHVPSVDRIVASVPNADTLKKHLIESHTSTEDVGRIATMAGVKLLVLSHFVPGDLPVTDEQWLEGVRKTYDGRVAVGRDLMEFALPLT